MDDFDNLEEWTDRKELDRINNVFEDEFDHIKKLIFAINQTLPGNPIGNIGLYSGNKMRQIYRFFQGKDVEYHSSWVNRAIEIHFIQQFDRAMECIEIFSRKVIRMVALSSDPSSLGRMIINSKEMQEYQKLCDEVYEFDIEKDVDKAINDCIDGQIVCGNVRSVNDWVKHYNKELKTLGIDKTIKERDIIIDTPEVSEKEALALLHILDEMIKQLDIEDDEQLFFGYETEEKEENQKNK